MMTEKVISRADSLVSEVEFLGFAFLRAAKRLPSHPHNFATTSSSGSNTHSEIPSSQNIRLEPKAQPSKTERSPAEGTSSKQQHSTHKVRRSELAGIGIDLEDCEHGIRIARIDPLGSVGRSGAEVAVGSRLLAVGDKSTLSAVRGAAEVTEWLEGEPGSRVTITVSSAASPFGREHGVRDSMSAGSEECGQDAAAKAQSQTFEVMRGSAWFLDQLLYVGAVSNLLLELSSSPGERLRPR